MIAIPFALLLIVAFIAWFAEAPREAKLIFLATEQNLADLDHTKLVNRRVWILVPVSTVLAVIAAQLSGPRGFIFGVELGALFLVITWASFVPAHRWKLNRMRKMDWRYVSPGNDYDWRFISFNEPNQWNQDIAKDHHTFNYANSPGYRNEIHRAGTLAYIFETFVLAASIVGAIAILNH